MTLIVLAAGRSERFPGNKLLHPLKGMPLYLHCLRRIQELPAEVFSKKIIVTQYDEIALTAEQMGFQSVWNNKKNAGLSHSIQLGLEQTKETEAICFLVCDQPYLSSDTLFKLVKGYQKSKKDLACVACGGNWGNPVIFSSSFREELLALRGDKGGKGILTAKKEKVYVHQTVNPMELWDMDTYEDYIERENV